MNDLNWILPGLASPIVYAAVSIGDKHIISSRGLRLGGFYLFIGIAQLTVGIIILLLLGWPDAAAGAVWASYAGGFLWGVGLMLMFMVLSREEVSRVMPVWQTSPVFAALLALWFLDESIAWYGWLAVLLVVAGAAGVSVGRTTGQRFAAFALRPTFFILVAGAAVIGLAQLMLKLGSEELNVWHNMAFRGAGLFTSIALPWLKGTYIRHLVTWFRVRRNAGILLLTEGAGPFTGNLLLLLAIENGPVSLVSALLGTRPVFVLAGTLALGVVAKEFLNERLTRADLLVKTASTAAVVAGVVVISVGWGVT